MAIFLEDITANNNDLTNNGAAEITSSLPFSQSTIAVDFELGDGDYLSAADSASLSITGDMTFEGWYNFESLPADGEQYVFLAKSNSGTSQRSYLFSLINVSGTYRLLASISDDGTNQNQVRTNWTPSTGTWYHVAITVDVSNAVATQFEFFIDGSSLGNGSVISDDSATAIYNSTAILTIGATNEGAAALFDGKSDEVRLWDDIRTGTEITNNKSIELVGNEANLVAYWPFESTLGASSAGFFSIL